MDDLGRHGVLLGREDLCCERRVRFDKVPYVAREWLVGCVLDRRGRGKRWLGVWSGRALCSRRRRLACRLGRCCVCRVAAAVSRDRGHNNDGLPACLRREAVPRRRCKRRRRPCVAVAGSGSARRGRLGACRRAVPSIACCNGCAATLLLHNGAVCFCSRRSSRSSSSSRSSTQDICPSSSSAAHLGAAQFPKCSVDNCQRVSPQTTMFARAARLAASRRTMATSSGKPFPPIEYTMPKEAYEARLHAAGSAKNWLYINAIVVVPALLAVAYYTVPAEIEHLNHIREHPKEYIPWPHLRKRKNPFPWGDDALFHNETFLPSPPKDE
ncbi:hypothetical protein BC831DRAFT_462807 [Entophlyctis helioformis]|nr:hypothetical protein BC831DRAFT_462807 [Entophlyctis helioformis]